MLSYNAARAWLHNNRLGLVLIFGTWATFFCRTLTGRSVYFLDDLKIIFYPLEIAYASFQDSWSLPLWSNQFGFGHPLLAWNQLGFFTPLHVILRLFHLHPLTLLQTSIVLYFGLGLFGFYLFLRHWKLSQPASALGAIIYVFGGFHVGHLNHVNFYTGTMLLPYLLLIVTAFIHRPTLFRTALLAAFAAAIPLSAQPQIALYTLIAAAVYGVSLFSFRWRSHRAFGLPLIFLTIASALLFLGLASFALLPLLEFLPLTERADGLPETDLLEFSYPPFHAITLLAPEFFGSHDNYWGEKGFQELSSYIGILPLIFLFAGLLALRFRHPLYVVSLIFLAASIFFSLGKYSPLYTYLVAHKIITSVSIPGRFLYFGLLAASFLCPLGLDALFRQPRRSVAPRLAISILLSGTIFLPFVTALRSDPRILTSFSNQLHLTNPPFSLAISGLALLVLLTLFKRFIPPTSAKFSLTLFASATLIVLGWNINPLTPRQDAFISSPPLAADLSSYSLSSPHGARLYSRPELYIDRTSRPAASTGTITDGFSVVALLPQDTPSCLDIPAYADLKIEGAVQISLLPEIGVPPVFTTSVRTNEIIDGEIHLCLGTLGTFLPTPHYLAFTSQGQTGINFYYTPENEAQNLYLVRRPNPSPAQLRSSLKEGITLLYRPRLKKTYDPAAVLLERHLNVEAGASSARWIGALSLRPYRDFIETFFANDRDDLIDGDGRHVLDQNRRLLDMAGITHLAQSYPASAHDLLPPALGLTVRQEFSNGNDTVRLYENPAAYPKAWLVSQAEFSPADDHTRNLMSDPSFDPRQKVFINGPVPPANNLLTNPPDPQAEVRISNYSPTSKTVTISTLNPAWLVLADATSPQWQTLLDNQPTPQYVANTMFQAAYIPAGQHTVEFRYHSPAVELSKKLTLLALLITFTFLISPLINTFLRQ